jgi:hypothetical protein
MASHAALPADEEEIAPLEESEHDVGERLRPLGADGATCIIDEHEVAIGHAGLAVDCGKEVVRAQLHIVVGDVKNPAGPARAAQIPLVRARPGVAEIACRRVAGAGEAAELHERPMRRRRRREAAAQNLQSARVVLDGLSRSIPHKILNSNPEPSRARSKSPLYPENAGLNLPPPNDSCSRSWRQSANDFARHVNGNAEPLDELVLDLEQHLIDLRDFTDCTGLERDNDLRLDYSGQFPLLFGDNTKLWRRSTSGRPHGLGGNVSVDSVTDYQLRREFHGYYQAGRVKKVLSIEPTSLTMRSPIICPHIAVLEAVLTEF